MTTSSKIQFVTNEFSGNRVLITGGTKGAGKAIADRFTAWVQYDVIVIRAISTRFGNSVPAPRYGIGLPRSA